MQSITVDELRSAYTASGLTPCRCGPGWRRLADGTIGGGPFFALYLEVSQVSVSPAMPDDSIDALAEASERWARERWGVEFYAAFSAGFDHANSLSLDGVLQCTPVERIGLLDGSHAGRLLDPVEAPSGAEVATC